MSNAALPRVAWLGQQPYAATMLSMRAVALADAAPDEIWLLEHPPTFTLGTVADASHISSALPGALVQSVRGGELTYHGPGMLIVYPLIRLRPAGLQIREWVQLLERVCVQVLSGLGLAGLHSRSGEPGLYLPAVDAPLGYRKLVSLGLRIRSGRSTHGLSIPVDMDLGPFSAINPCGMAGLEMTDLRRACPQAYDLLSREARDLRLPGGAVQALGIRMVGALLDEIRARCAKQLKEPTHESDPL